MGIIYKVTNKQNGKIYIGQTRVCIEKRWVGHKTHSKRKCGKDYNNKFHNAIRKYGSESFVIEPIEECPNSLLNEREIYWIEKLESYKRDIGYNTSRGGLGVSTVDEKLLLQYWKDGYTLSQIHNMFHISRGTSSFYLKKNGISSNEIRARGYNANNFSKSRAVHRYSKDGEYIDSFTSVGEVHRILGFSNVSASARRESYAYGYMWSYRKVDLLNPYKRKKPNYSVKQHYKSKPVALINEDGSISKVFENSRDAGEYTKKDKGCISKNCQGKHHFRDNTQFKYITFDEYKKYREATKYECKSKGNEEPL